VQKVSRSFMEIQPRLA